MPDDSQPEPGPTSPARPCPVDPVKALENPLLVAPRDADALVADPDASPVATAGRLDVDGAARLGVLDGVVDKVATLRKPGRGGWP